MTFSPVIPVGGYAGWTFLKRTMAQQTAAFNAQPSVKRDEAYFREKIGSIDTAEQLVNDPRLLRVALGAFGLESDIGNKFFVRKILESNTFDPVSLANRLANKQYQKMAAAFGFGDFPTPSSKISDFADKLLTPYKNQQFAVAVGAKNGDMRLALNLETELPALAGSSASPLAKWYSVLGNPPLRTVFERAFRLPPSFGAIDIEKQVTTLQQRAAATFGSSAIEQFSDPKKVEQLVRGFLLQSELASGGVGASGQQVALSLLQQSAQRFR